MKEPITIADYDPRWPERFEILRARLFKALGPVAAAIEHVGSTAIPGLAAKPIIDVDVLLCSESDLQLGIERLATLGYEHQGDLGIPGREAFRAPTSEFPHHLYVCSPDHREYDRHITFRDHLRSHPEDARAYELLKRSLAGRFGSDRESYTLAKADFIEAILRRAKPVASEHFSRHVRTIP
jgi:GrpB-like predicted nucleotidyltransferase (UPF0157 family)